MIIKNISANDPRFKANDVDFGTGLNVILADRHVEDKESQSAGQLRSANGAGKSTLLELFHFCLGKDSFRDKKSIFNKKELGAWNFTLTLDHDGKQIVFTRPVNKKGKISITPGFVPEGNEASDVLLRELGSTTFNKYLGRLLFDLPVESAEKYSPKSRALLSYLIRTGRTAYDIPFANGKDQQLWDQQACTMFLLRLDPSFASQWQSLRDREKSLANLRKSLPDTGLFDEIRQKPGALLNERTRLMAKAEAEEKQLRSFRVHPQYEELERAASQLTDEIHDLSNRNFEDEQLIAHYRQAASDIKEADPASVEAVYLEAGLAFPDRVRSQLSDVKAFHDNIVKNRREFLQEEIRELENVLQERRNRVHLLSDQRATIMQTLSEHGALRDYFALQKRHVQTEHKLEQANRAYELHVRLDESRAEIRQQRVAIQTQAQRDYRQREELLREALLTFSRNAEMIYGVDGDLVIDIVESGYRFDIDIPRARSQGISNMKILCFDLMLAQLKRYQRFPKFLVHDSMLFDGVDGRQRARAIELAAVASEKYDFQYIMAINRDDVPWSDFSPGFEEQFRKAIRLELSDVGDGGLLGFQL